MFISLSLIFSLLFIYKNPLFYISALLITSIISFMYLVLNSFVSTLTGLILVIIYVGAIIILIGYICAVSPNLILKRNFNYIYLWVFLLISYFITSTLTSSNFITSTLTLTDYFYSLNGLISFLIITLILFITLLIVTSQFTSPKGPFRSI